MRRIFRILPVATILSFGSLSGVEAACATGHVAATLADFPSEAVSSPFYWGPEDAGQITFILRAIADDCTPNAVTISYQTKDGSATSPADYLTSSGSRAVTTDPTHGSQDRQPVPVSVTSDPVPEAVVESAIVELTGVQGGGHLSPPTSAALHIIDDDGPAARISLDGGAVYRQLETYSSAGVAVFRAGPTSGTTTVNFTVEPGPAPAAKAGNDYKAESGTLTFAPGDRIEMIPITLVNDKETELEENLTITLTGADGGVIDGPASAKFSILDNEELDAPESLFHHPRNKWKYKAKDYRIREIHVFTKDNGTSGVAAAEMGLRRNMKSGSCSWWSGSKWKRRSCNKELWLKMGMYEADFFFIRVPALEPSRRKIESYTAISRAIDGAGNREERFEPGRNQNTFDIK
ncbi:MAG: Calx-beta domain-containing protein [Actinomycetota bacterium]